MKKFNAKTKILISTLLLIALVIVASVMAFNKTLSDLNIKNLHISLGKSSVENIRFSTLSFSQKTDTATKDISLNNVAVSLDWTWWQLPSLDVISIETAAVSIHPSKQNNTNIENNEPLLTLPSQWKIPDALPNSIEINNVLINFACQDQECSLIGSAYGNKTTTGANSSHLNFSVKANPGKTILSTQQLILSGQYSIDKNLPTLKATINLANNIALELTTNLQENNGGYWQGNLKGTVKEFDPLWLDFIEQNWGINIENPINKTTADTNEIQLASKWKLATGPLLKLTSETTLNGWKEALTGNVSLDANIPTAIHIVELGKFYGQIQLSFAVNSGQLQDYTLTSTVNASELVVPEKLQKIGAGIETLTINIASKNLHSSQQTHIPLDISGATTGNIKSKFSGQLDFEPSNQKLTANSIAISGQATQLTPLTDISLKKLNVDLTLSGYIQPENFSVAISQPIKISADITTPTLKTSASDVQLTSSNFKLSGAITNQTIDWQHMQFSGELALKTATLIQPQLAAFIEKPSSWQWQGELAGSPEQFKASGELTLAKSFVVKHEIKREAANINITWQSRDIFLLAGNPFAELIKAWPPLLSMTRGKLSVSGNALFNIEKNNLVKSTTSLQAFDISGIYDTMVFQGLNTYLTIKASDNSLSIASDDLSIKELNKGFLFGPLYAQGHYQTSWKNPTKGKLVVKKFNGTAMDGSVSIDPQEFDFSRENQAFMLKLQNINLSTLLLQYPTSELSGNGQLSGTIPIEITAAGIRVNQGFVAAAAPGGQLKYKSQKAIELAKNQPGMKVITQALDDFHYSVLATEVNYDDKGKLILSVRLEGKNPALENGRPINLNVKLEEDIPAMLASIQLSSKVSDVIKNRIQEKLQKK